MPRRKKIRLSNKTMNDFWWVQEEHVFEALGVIVRQQRSYVEVQEKMLGEYTVDEHSVFIHGYGSRNDSNKIAPFEVSVERSSEDRSP